MYVHVAREPGLVAAANSGRFDAHGVEQFNREVFDQIEADHAHVISNAAGVEFTDSNALAECR